MMRLLDVLRCVFMSLINFLFCFQFNPELIIVSAGFDSAIGDEKVTILLLLDFISRLFCRLLFDSINSNLVLR